MLVTHVESGRWTDPTEPRDPNQPVGTTAKFAASDIEDAVRSILHAIGIQGDSEVMRETPRRVLGWLREILAPPRLVPTTFPNDGRYSELVIVRNVPFRSICEHHLLPFSGVVHLAYLPADRLIGLSKLARAVEMFAGNLQMQERLTTQIADWLMEVLEPTGSGVVIEAEHLCLTLRGAKAVGAVTITSALRGALQSDPRTRSEFLALVQRK
jgi:GTP cyclohydrolase I